VDQIRGSLKWRDSYPDDTFSAVLLLGRGILEGLNFLRRKINSQEKKGGK
jgi:hypothetical protein